MAISVGSVEVDVIPNTQGIYSRLLAGLVPAATRAGDDAGRAAGRAFGPSMQGSVGNIGLSLGQQIGQQIADRITAQIRSSLQQGINQGGAQARGAATRQGEETGGAFARAMKARLEAAFRSMPKINVRLSDTGVDADLARLRARMETLSNKRIGVDVDVAAADAELADIEERLRRLGASHPNVAVRADTAAARAQLAAMREEIARLTADPARIRLETDGSFGARLRAAVQAAEASLPNINIGADTGPAEAEIASLRAQLTALRDQRVGIDIDAATATAKLEELQGRLARLAASNADVNVRVDSAAAAAQLAQVQAMVAALDGQTARIDIDTSGALSAVFQLSVALAGLAALPALPILTAGFGAVTASAVATGVGVGALAAAALPALSGVKGALEAQKAAQDATTSATNEGGRSASQAASKALQLAGAQQALATAQRNAGRQIADAQRGVADATRQAARANEQAAQQVQGAQRAVADAVQQAAERQQQAAGRVQQAEQSLAQAQRSARQAQLDLTRARGDAVRQLEDMNNQLADAQLAQRSAILQIQEAKLSLDKVLTNPAATELQRAQARLTYDEALQRLKEQQVSTKRLQADTTAANKAGVEGATAVRSAQDRLAQSQQDVTDKAAALKQAQADVAKTQVANARAIADAQGKLAEAQKNVAVVQEQGAEAVAKAQERVVQAQQSAADSIASAQRQIQSAQLSTAAAASKAATAQDKYEAALAKLSPAARQTFDAFVSLRSAFTAWSKSLQPAVMPIFTRALDGIKNSLPGLTPLVLGAARAISTLQDRVSVGFKSPWWKALKQDLATSVEPAIVSFGVSLANIFKGTAGIIQAFLSHLGGIDSRMERITGRFATWGTNLKGNPAFEHFLAYSAEQAPILAQALGKIGSAFLAVSRALSPLSGPVLQTLGALADSIAWLAINVPGAIQAMYGLFIVTRLWAVAQVAGNAALAVYRTGVVLAALLTGGWTAAILAANAAFAANPIVIVIAAIVAAIVLLVGAVIYAWNHWAWFRQSVLAVWSAIQTAALWAWANVLQPVFSAIGTALQAVGAAAVWLWQNAIQPVFSAIWTAARILLAILVVAVITPVILAIKLLGAVAMWLWTDAIRPAFQAIAIIALWLWHNAIEPAKDGIVAAFRFVASIGTWLWENALAPAFRGIASVATWLWRNAIEPVFGGISNTISNTWRNGIQPTFNLLKSGLSSVGDAFNTGVNYIGRVFDTIRDKTRKPVQFVIDTVYNNGIRAVWNEVAGFLKLDELDIVKFANGGMVPGYAPRRDTVPAILSPGEGVLVPETVRALGGGGAIAALNSWGRGGAAPFADGGVVQRFGDGGIAGDILNGITGAAKTVGGWAGSGLDLLMHPSEIWDKAIKPTLKLISQVGTSKWAQAIGKIPLKMVTGLKDKLVDAATSIFSSGGDGGGGSVDIGGSGVTRWTGVVQQALKMLGQPAAYTGITLRRMNQESGGNPTIVNKWDSNWLAGYPSVGLMQVIGPTFDSYAGAMRNVGPKMYGVSVNPLANVYSSMRYALAAYGSLPSAYNRAGGYDSGGYLQPGLNLAYNGTGRPEPVFTSQQASALMRMATDPAAGMGDLHVQVYVGDREISDIARAEVRRSNGQLVSTLRAGRR